MRLATIDTLRGLAILAMILIHSAAYFLSDKAAFYVWNYSQFAVPIFFFCSSYLFFYKENLPTIKSAYPYFKKRLLRLLIPFYLYLAAYFVVVGIFERDRLTPEFVLRHLTMTTIAPEANWIVILFAIFAFLMPLFAYLFRHKRTLLFGYLAISLLSSVYLMFFRFPLHFKLIMWLPWSIIVLFGLFFVKNERKKWFFPATIIFSFGVFILTFFIQIALGNSLVHFNNKYPPNLYYLSYGIFFITILFYFFEKDVVKFKSILKPVHFLSVYSYSIFFIHFIVLYVLIHVVDYKKLGWVGVFAVVFAMSVVIQRVGLRFVNAKIS